MELLDVARRTDCITMYVMAGKAGAPRCPALCNICEP